MIATIRSESDLFGPIETEISLCETRMKEWRPDFAPRNPREEWLFTQIVVHSLRVDRCLQHESALLARQAQRSRLCWQEDRRAEAEVLFQKLHKTPGLVVAKLMMTRQGCELLIERWKSLAMSLEHGVEWSEAQRKMAIDLLGTHPAFRSAIKFDLLPKELVAREVAKIEAHVAEKIVELDAMDQKYAIQGLAEPSADLKAVTRYEAQCRRRMEWARNEFFKGREGKPRVDKSPVVTAPKFQVESDYEPMSDEEYKEHEEELFRRLVGMKPDRPEPLHPVSHNAPTTDPRSTGPGKR